MTASHAPSTVARKATNVSLSETVLAERRAALWVAENAKAFECWNDYVEKNGLPLAKYRSF